VSSRQQQRSRAPVPCHGTFVVAQFGTSATVGDSAESPLALASGWHFYDGATPFAPRSRALRRQPLSQIAGYAGIGLVVESAARDAEENDDCSTESDHVVIAEPPDRLAELGAWNRRDLVHHQVAGLSNSVRLIRSHRKPKQWRLGGIRGERTDGHRRGGIESIILDNDDRSRFSDVPAACRCGPDLTASHPSSELRASMNAWSSVSCVLAATAADCRWACSTNCGERTSGTQICTGRRP